MVCMFIYLDGTTVLREVSEPLPSYYRQAVSPGSPLITQYNIHEIVMKKVGVGSKMPIYEQQPPVKK